MKHLEKKERKKKPQESPEGKLSKANFGFLSHSPTLPHSLTFTPLSVRLVVVVVAALL